VGRKHLDINLLSRRAFLLTLSQSKNLKTSSELGLNLLAGIDVEGENRWTILIQNASSGAFGLDRPQSS